MKLSRRSLLAATPASILGGSGGFPSRQVYSSGAVSLAEFGPLFRSDDAPVIQAALRYASENGLELDWPEGAYTIRQPLTGGSIRLRFSGEVTVVYTGLSQVEAVIAVSMAGRDTALLGQLVIDGRGRANVGLRIHNENPVPADLTVGDIEARNCRMVRGHPFNAGAAGIIIRGNIGRLTGDRLWAENISRAAGSGRIGYFGTNGVDISRTAGYAPRQIALGIVGADDVTADDPPGSAQCFDIDGVAVLQNDVEGASLSILHLDVTNAQGRALKTQCYRSCRVERASVLRSIAGMTDGSNEIAFQMGEGTIGRAEIVYRGDADMVHGQGTICIATYTTTRRDRYGPTVFENIVVRDETVGATRIAWLLDTTNEAAGDFEHSTTIRNFHLEGRSAGALVNVRRNGSPNRPPYTLDVAGFSGELTEAVVLCDGPVPNMTVRLSYVRNSGDPVPAVRSGRRLAAKEALRELTLRANHGVILQ